MAYGFDDLIENLKKARTGFHKHLDGITPEQWAWKPYPSCKSIGETVKHLVWGDTAILQGISTGEQPDYATVPEGHPSESQEELTAQLHASHGALVEYLIANYASSPLDTEVNFYGHPMKLGNALSSGPAEDGYHSGQVAFVRMATDPTWDYYTHMYS